MRYGNIKFDVGTIGASTARSQFVATYPNAKLVVENGAHRTYRFGPAKIRGRPFVANVSFVDETLHMIVLAAAVDDAPGWSEVSPADLTTAKVENDAWLAEEFDISSDSMAFSWGRVESAIAKKTGCAEIVLSYQKEEECAGRPVPG